MCVCVCAHRQRLFENLRMLPHAPGVQMQAIPEDAIQEDSGDEEEDPDKRISSMFTHLSLASLGTFLGCVCVCVCVCVCAHTHTHTLLSFVTVHVLYALNLPLQMVSLRLWFRSSHTLGLCRVC